MREIKFRAWSKLEQKWLEIDNLLVWIDGSITNVRTDDRDSYAVEEVELQQYTGLKDKNGVGIYEGDIVSKEGERGYVVFLQQEMGYVIVFKNRDERLGHRNTGSAYHYDERLEVIGNIYEHSHLLQEETK